MVPIRISKTPSFQKQRLIVIISTETIKYGREGKKRKGGEGKKKKGERKKRKRGDDKKGKRWDDKIKKGFDLF
jgi:hypothetical protein